MNSKQIAEVVKEQLEKYFGKVNDLHKEIFDVLEVAEYLNLSPSYIRKLTSIKAIPHRKPTGKRLYFVKSEIDTWIQDSKRRG
jgi:excisionase family DNA binding protein